ncbi:iron chelate uptake ABC transporter family permease subunit [Vibrio parahaemolyticus]|nr:iron chelate uptake ABC transporter family permease subunit [Vibrio parahaemolyticus]
MVLSTVSLFVGVADMTPQQLFSGDAKALELFFTSRIPRLFAILLAGAGLSIAGLVMQQISQNRFAAPSTTGTIECAMLGYVMSVVFFGDGDHLWLVFAFLFIGIGLNADNYQYFLSRRVPKVLAIVLAGVAIAQSSMVFQTITHNRILTPSIMGFDALYVLTQVLIVLLFGGLSTLVLNIYVNFTIAACIMVAFSLLLFGFYFSKGSRNLITLLLVGLIFGQLFSNVASFFSLLMDPNTFAFVQSKLYASFNNVKVNLVYFSAPMLILACWLLFRMHRTLDVFWLDQDNAKSLGVDVPKVTRNVFILSAVLIAISTALVGPIMFFGLLVTNLSREMFHSYQHKTLLIGCSLLAISSLLSGQWIIENVFNFETTLSVVINFLGGIYFLYLLLKNKVV